jgi:hypothetical protein
MLPKPKRETSKKYLEYIKTLPCCCRDNDCTGDSVPHHTITKGAGGSDLLTVPLCGFHHYKVHLWGRSAFQTFYNIDFQDIIIANLIGYIKKLEGKQ